MTDMRMDEIVIPASLPSPAPDSPLEALSWLGDTVEEVAEGLRARGIKGTLRESDSCALARYLQEWWPDARVAVGKGWLVNSLPNMWTNPDVLRDFEERFDNSQFPDLIDNG